MRSATINSVTELRASMGFGPPSHPLITIIDFSKATLFASTDEATVTLNLYSVALKTGDIPAIQYGRRSYDFSVGALLATAPGQQMHIKAHADKLDFEGWGLYFDPELLVGHQLADSIADFGFFSYAVFEALHVSERERTLFDHALASIAVELDCGIDRHSHGITLTALHLLLQHVDRSYQRQFTSRTPHIGEAATRLRGALTAHYAASTGDPEYPSVAQLARTLGMSADYLTDVLKSQTGFGAKEHIQRFVIARAKDELITTSKAVSQIGYALGYAHPHSFSAAFRRQTGVSPTQYRAAN